MLIAVYPLVLAVIGALVYALATNAVAKELGRITFAAGIFAFAFATAQHVFHVAG